MRHCRWSSEVVASQHGKVWVVVFQHDRAQAAVESWPLAGSDSDSDFPPDGDGFGPESVLKVQGLGVIVAQLDRAVPASGEIVGMWSELRHSDDVD